MGESETDIGSLSRDGIGCSIRPGVAVPPTLLVAEMNNGAMLLQGWRIGPSAYLCATDAGPLRQALAAAFGADVTITGRSAAARAHP